jgi:hypothetical protein
VSIRINFGKYQ